MWYVGDGTNLNLTLISSFECTGIISNIIAKLQEAKKGEETDDTESESPSGSNCGLHDCGSWTSLALNHPQHNILHPGGSNVFQSYSCGWVYAMRLQASQKYTLNLTLVFTASWEALKRVGFLQIRSHNDFPYKLSICCWNTTETVIFTHEMRNVTVNIIIENSHHVVRKRIKYRAGTITFPSVTVYCPNSLFIFFTTFSFVVPIEQ